MLDLHVHVLPGIDDGPRTLEDALALARALVEDGIEHIVATPHIYPGVFDNTAARISEVFDEFQAAVSDADIDLAMTWAAEVRICPEILEWIEVRRLPMLNGSLVGPSTALIELPDGQIPVGTDKLMGLMLDRGITPLMAHPERNKAVMEQHTRLDALRRLGCKFQVTAGSLLGDFGTRAQTTAHKLLEAGWVDVIATDAHNRSSRRPRMKAAREWLVQQYDEALALQLTSTNPTEIAGISSFSVQSGEQRLVFRDLPAMAPLDSDALWSVDLMLGPDTSAPSSTSSGTSASADLRLDPLHSARGTPDERWSLIDFRMNGLVEELTVEHFPQRGHEHDVAAPPASMQGASDEDWQLPMFRSTAPAAAAPVDRPAATPVPASAPVPAPVAVSAPTVEVVAVEAVAVRPSRSEPEQRIEPIWEPVAVRKPVIAAPHPHPATASVKQAAAPVPAPTPVVIAAATPTLPPQGMRLSEVTQRKPPTPPVEPSRKVNGMALRPNPMPMAQAGHQTTAPVDPSKSIAAVVRAGQKETSEHAPLPHPDGTRRGFRLSDLNPLPTRRR